MCKRTLNDVSLAKKLKSNKNCEKRCKCKIHNITAIFLNFKHANKYLLNSNMHSDCKGRFPNKEIEIKKNYVHKDKGARCKT